MNKNDILFLCKYDQWSTNKILTKAAQVTLEQFLAPAPFPHGGLRGTLVHALFAQWIWRNRWQGTSPTYGLQVDDFPTFASLRSRWLEEQELMMAFVENLTDQKLQSEFSYTSTEGKPYTRILWQAMAHVVNHGTQYKTEAAAILTSFNSSPGDIDMIWYAIEHH